MSACRAPRHSGMRFIPRNGETQLVPKSPAAMVDRGLREAQSRTGKQMSKDGMCVVITGSASGLGAATAMSLAKDGARIVINYASSQKEAEQTADLCRTAGAEVVVVQGDVSRDEDCRKVVAA